MGKSMNLFVVVGIIFACALNAVCDSNILGSTENWAAIANVNLGTEVVSIIKDPSRSFVYAIDSANSEILFVDVKNMTVSKRLYVGEAPRCCDINEDGTCLYVGHGGSGSETAGSYQIAKVSLDTQEAIDSFIIPTVIANNSLLRAENITCGSGNTVYYNSGYKIWNSGLARRMDGFSGADLGALARIKSPMVISPDKSKLYGQYIYTGNLGEMGVWDVSGSSIQKVDSLRYSPYPYGWDYNNYSMSGDGQFIAYGKILFNANSLIDQKGVFDELVYGLSFDGSIAFGKTAVWDTTTFEDHGAATKISDLPFDTAVMDFDHIENRLYSFNSDDHTLYVIGAPYVGELTLSFPGSADESDGVLSGEVCVEEAPLHNLSVNLVSDDISEISIPGSPVVISAGQTRASFNIVVKDDVEVDGTQTVTITASAVGCPDVSRDISVYDNEGDALSLKFPGVLNENTGVVTGMVVFGAASETDLSVSFYTSDASLVVLPTALTMSAGQTNLSFAVQLMDDQLLNGTREVEVHAWADGYTKARLLLSVYDDEMARLILSLPQTTYEGAGTIGGVLQVDPAPDVNVVVDLVSNNPEKIGSSTVEISAGQTFVSFSLPVGDDAMMDGVQTATIEARVQNWTSSRASVFIFDNETTGITLNLPASVNESDGAIASAGSIVLPGSVMIDTHVLLSVSDTTELTLPAFVTVPAGTNAVQFDVTAEDDAETDGAQQVSVVAESPGYIPASCSVEVGDNDVHHLAVGLTDLNPSVMSPVLVDISAMTVDGGVIADYSGSVSLVASGDGGGVSVVSSTVTNFSGGVVSGDVVFGRVANHVTLVADSGGGISGTSSVFNVMGPILSIMPDALTNTLVVSGDSVSRTMIISNAGNADLEFEIQGVGSSLDEGLILHYTFDDDNGTTVVDQSGTGNNGVWTNSCVYTNGVLGQGLRIHGNSDEWSSAGGHVLLPEIDINSLDEISISLWVKEEIKHHPHGEAYISLGVYDYSINPGHILIGDYSGGVIYKCGDESEDRSQYFSPITNEFAHYVLTCSGGVARAYQNGVLLEEFAGVLNVPNSEFAALGRHWWGDGDSTSTRLTAVFDEVRIYNRELSASEVSELYREGDEGGDGVVAYYPFNGNANDESGNGYDGTVNGAMLTTDRFGNEDSAFLFDGVKDYIRIGADPDVPSWSNYTVSVWFLNDGGGDQSDGYGQKILDKTSWYHDFYLTARTSGALLYHTYENSTAVNLGDSSYDYRDNAWHHMAVSKEGNVAKVWVDGALMGISSNAPNVSSTADLLIGYSESGDYLQRKYWSGKIDDLRVFDRALSSNEISGLYNGLPSGPELSQPGWLSADPVSGTVPPGGGVSVNITFDAAGLAVAETYSGALTLTCNDVISSTNTVPVSMQIVGAAEQWTTNTITFEPPVHPQGSIEIPSYLEKGLVFSTPSGMAHVGDLASDGYPKNGSAYLNFSATEKPLTCSTVDGRTFAVEQVDLAEYSTVYASPKLIPFIGTRLDGSTVSVTFKLDGLIDGRGGVEDFQTFEFPPNFRNLVSLQVTLSIYCMDNFVIATASESSSLVAMQEDGSLSGKSALTGLNEDFDGDGLSNRSEYIAGTDPTNPNSSFMVNPVKTGAGEVFIVNWEAVTGRVYSVWWKNGLGKSFQPLETGIGYPQNSYTDTVHGVEGCGFYKVDVELAPVTSD